MRKILVVFASFVLLFALVILIGFVFGLVILKQHEDKEFVKKHPYLFEDKEDDGKKI